MLLLFSKVGSFSPSNQDPRIDFQIEGAKIVLYLVFPRGAPLVDAGGENFVYLFARTQENAFLDTFSKNFAFVPQLSFCSTKK